MWQKFAAKFDRNVKCDKNCYDFYIVISNLDLVDSFFLFADPFFSTSSHLAIFFNYVPNTYNKNSMECPPSRSDHFHYLLFLIFFSL